MYTHCLQLTFITSEMDTVNYSVEITLPMFEYRYSDH